MGRRSHSRGFVLTGLFITVLLMPIATRLYGGIRSSIGPTAINVRDFGAVGDGRTDDTAAIQRAVNAYNERYKKQKLRVKHHRHEVPGSDYYPHAEIVFPAGTYRITRPVVFGRSAYLRGIGRTVIEQANPDQDILYFEVNRQSYLENLHFKGGKTQLHFWTRNTGGAQLTVERCTFSDSADDAIRCRIYTQKKIKGEKWRYTPPWAPYEVKWTDGQPTLTPNHTDNLEEWFNSTLLAISDSRFDNCMGVVDSNCDTLVIRDSSIVANPDADGPVFDIWSGETHLYNVRAQAPAPAPGKHPYWIEGGGILSVRNCEFDNAGEAGMGFIRVNRIHRPASVTVGGFCIVVQNTRVKAAGCPDNALLWLCKGTQPDILSMTHVVETTGRPVKAVAWEDPAALQNLRKFALTITQSTLKDQYKIELHDNSVNIDPTFPAALRPFEQKPIPQEAIERTFVPPPDWSYDDLQNQASKVIYAADYGLDADTSTDDTAAIQKVFEAAAAAGNCQVIFPAYYFKLSDTIRIPSNVIVRGAGMAAFEQTDPKKDLFRLENPRRVGFKSCLLSGGRRGLNITTDDKTPVRIALDNCWISDQHETGIHCMAGEGKTGESNNTQLLFGRGKLNTVPHGLITNAALSQISDSWLSNDAWLNEQAFIENRGGSMRIVANLGNPVSWTGKRSRPPAHVKDWPYSRDTRWIDNWGRLYSIDTRYDGESGGICNVFSRSTDGTIYIGGGVSRYHNGLTKSTILYMARDPAVAVLRNISSEPFQIDGSSRTMRPADRPGRPNLFVSGVMEPQAERK